ncbi:hypothetical protein V1284_006910 [Nitrobacteraceae bacterium AZCC 2299]
MAVARFRHSGSVQLATSSASRIGYESFRMRGLRLVGLLTFVIEPLI